MGVGDVGREGQVLDRGPAVIKPTCAMLKSGLQLEPAVSSGVTLAQMRALPVSLYLN